jgi:hypothetical protein
MSLALIQPAAGLTFGPSEVRASATETYAVGLVVKVTDANLIASTPSVDVTDGHAGTAAGLYGVVTTEITATKDGTVAFSGIQDATAGTGGVSAGDLLTVEADGQVITATTGDFVVGYALEAISADATGKAFMAGCPAIVTSA